MNDRDRYNDSVNTNIEYKPETLNSSNKNQDELGESILNETEPGMTVYRQHFQNRLWPNYTFDFPQNLIAEYIPQISKILPRNEICYPNLWHVYFQAGRKF
jgi:hypothetical protein